MSNCPSQVASSYPSNPASWRNFSHWPKSTPPNCPRPSPIWRGLLLIEAGLRWLLAYPFYLAQVLVLVLIAWAGLGAELGAEHLFWNEDVWIQLGTGAAVGMLFGAILFVLYILYPP